MKRILLAGMACVVSAHVMAEAPLWLRDVAISPDGKSIAFTYKGAGVWEFETKIIANNWL